ncbi:protein kinase domain containing protein [Planoprotostelium fungivorum]|uniref:Protein kinase domain containing protein n=1 Tax=Planoprotostelium fungivorum TaxID=1890364 RepID=A0A2P6MXP7_9EUKA|nr:protein kinase domain containing protein [Planoprotostelium fungivorum]
MSKNGSPSSPGSGRNTVVLSGTELTPVLRGLVERAIDGKLTSVEYKGEFSKFLKDTNEKVLAHHNLTMDKSLMTSEAQVPVVDLLLGESSRWGTDSLTIVNNGKKSLYFQVRQKIIDKYQLEALPFQGKIRKGETKRIEFKFRAFCTSKFYQLLQIQFSLKKEDLSGTVKKRGIFMRGAEIPPPRPQASIDEILRSNSLVVCLRIESELSAFLDYDEVVLGDKLAGGAFGTVHKATWRDSEVAVKVLHNADQMTTDERDLVKREIALMSKLSFPYIVTYMGSTAAVASQPLCMVMEYIRGGSLTSLIKKQEISFRFRVKVSLDVAKGMAYLHSHNIYHRDLKPDNFLVISQHDDVDVNLKITDFGTSRSNKKSKEDLQRVYGIEDTSSSVTIPDFTSQPGTQEINEPEKQQRNLTNGVGTLIYQAPETLGGQTDYNIEKTDIYSFGVSLLHIFTGIEPYSVDPFDKFSVWDIINFVTRGERLEVSGVEDYRIRNMILNCWQDKPEKRPKFSQVRDELLEILKSAGPQPNPSSPAAAVSSPTKPASVRDQEYTMDDRQQTTPPRSLTSRSLTNPIQPTVSSESPGTAPQSPQSPRGESMSNGSGEKRGMVVPQHADQLCWCGNLDRIKAEQKLLAPHVAPLTFLTRWSDNMGSYVLTYKKREGGLEHIAHIMPVGDGKITVRKSDGTSTPYDSLLKYIDTLREERVIANAYTDAPSTAPGTSLYSFSN